MSMSKEQAIAYIEAGKFPQNDDLASITRLQDEFGHFNPDFLCQLAHHYPADAPILFCKLWGWEQTRQILLQCNQIRDLRLERLDLEYKAWYDENLGQGIEREQNKLRMASIDTRLAEYEAAYPA